MRKSLFAEDQIIGILKDQDYGQKTADVSRRRWQCPQRVGGLLCRMSLLLSAKYHTLDHVCFRVTPHVRPKPPPSRPAL